MSTLSDTNIRIEQQQPTQKELPTETQSKMDSVQNLKMCECCGKRRAVMKVIPCEDEMCSICVATGARCPICGAIILTVTSL